MPLPHIFFYNYASISKFLAMGLKTSFLSRILSRKKNDALKAVWKKAVGRLEIWPIPYLIYETGQVFPKDKIVLFTFIHPRWQTQLLSPVWNLLSQHFPLLSQPGTLNHTASASLVRNNRSLGTYSSKKMNIFTSQRCYLSFSDATLCKRDVGKFQPLICAIFFFSDQRRKLQCSTHVIHHIL